MQVGQLVKINPNSDVWTGPDAVLKVIENRIPQVDDFGWITTEVISGEAYHTLASPKSPFITGMAVVGHPTEDFLEITDANEG